MATRTNKPFAACALLIGVLAGCGHSLKVRESAPAVVGADRDEHGCIGSAGYAWCSREQSCVRSWELARAKGFENSFKAFGEYCSGTPP